MGLLVIIGLILLLPFAVTLAVPMRHFPLYLAWVGMLAILYSLYPSGPDHSSPYSGIDASVNVIILILFGVAVFIKLLIYTRSDTSTDTDALATDPAIGGTGETSDFPNIPMIATGALAGVFVVCVLAVPGAAARPFLSVHGTAVGIAVLLSAFSPTIASLLRARASVRQFTLGLRWSSVIFSAGAALWLWNSIDTVIARAEAVAGEKPYCIQVTAVRDNFAPAIAQINFSPLTMRARCSQGFCWQNHAILIVENGDAPSLWNWSYRKKEFFQNVLNVRTNPPKIVCKPSRHFARDLPLF